MKRSIYRSLRGELVIYSIISMMLAVVTEFTLGIIVAKIARSFGTKRIKYGKDMNISPDKT